MEKIRLIIDKTLGFVIFSVCFRCFVLRFTKISQSHFKRRRLDRKFYSSRDLAQLSSGFTDNEVIN